MINKTVQTISAVEARKGLGMLLNRVSLRHETFVIERSGRKIAVLKEYESNTGESVGLAADNGGQLDLRDLAGVGADIWRTVDVDDYIHRERSTWS